MASDVQELYDNLNKLLYDICEFLNDEIKQSKLSPNTRAEADLLINRSKTQLQQINKYSVNKVQHNSPDTYVVMGYDNTKPANKTDGNEEKSVISNEASTSVLTDLPCPYKDTSAKNLPSPIQYGSLKWKTKGMLNFEKHKPVYGAIQDEWFLIYSDNTKKLLRTFYLQKFEAKSIEYNLNNKNPVHEFVLINKQKKKKIYYFTALTSDKMMNWVSKLNRSNEIAKDTNITTDTDSSVIYDSVPDYPSTTSEEQHYDIINPTRLTTTLENNDNNPTTITTDRMNRSPNPRYRINKPLPRVPESTVSSTTSLESQQIYAVPSNTTTSSNNAQGESDPALNSFSENDDDDIYEIFVNMEQEDTTIIRQTVELNTTLTSPIKPPEVPKKPLKRNIHDSLRYTNYATFRSQIYNKPK